MILVFATPRSGSSWFVSRYLTSTEQYRNYKSVGEPFDRYKFNKAEQVEMLDRIKSKQDIIVKVFPEHLVNPLPNLMHHITEAAEKIYVLVRKNYNAQLQSIYIADQTSYFYSDDLPLRTISYDREKYEQHNEEMQVRYHRLLEIYRSLSDQGELIFLEDLPDIGKYKQPVVWSDLPPVIDFNVEGLFDPMLTTITEAVLNEPEFKKGGFVWSHIVQRKSDPMVAVRSAVDRMRDLHDIPDNQFNNVCYEVLKGIQAKVAGF